MLGPAKSRRVDQPLAVSLGDLVPSDHLYRHLEANVFAPLASTTPRAVLAPLAIAFS